jgi:hypothetical protein
MHCELGYWNCMVLGIAHGMLATAESLHVRLLPLKGAHESFICAF